MSFTLKLCAPHSVKDHANTVLCFRNFGNEFGFEFSFNNHLNFFNNGLILSWTLVYNFHLIRWCVIWNSYLLSKSTTHQETKDVTRFNQQVHAVNTRLRQVDKCPLDIQSYLETACHFSTTSTHLFNIRMHSIKLLQYQKLRNVTSTQLVYMYCTSTDQSVLLPTVNSMVPEVCWTFWATNFNKSSDNCFFKVSNFCFNVFILLLKS